MAKRVKPQSKIQPVHLGATSNVENVPSIYVNNVEILAVNPIDVRIAFNEVLAERPNVFTPVRRVNLVMSTASFLALIPILNQVGGQIQQHQMRAFEQMRVSAQAALEAK
jgi:hypothetical protein